MSDPATCTMRLLRQALSIPVLANGNIRHLQDANACMEYTGCDGVLSAESLLEDPALFSPHRLEPEVRAYVWRFVVREAAVYYTLYMAFLVLTSRRVEPEVRAYVWRFVMRGPVVYGFVGANFLQS